MNKFDQEFKRIVEGLEIDDKPRSEHKDRLRWQMMSEFNDSCVRDVSSLGGFHRIGRFIMDRKFAGITAAAVIIAAIIIGVTVFGGPDNVENDIVNNDKKNQKVEQVVKDENDGAVAKDINNETGIKSLTPENKELEQKHVQELFAAKDADGLIEVLKTGSSEGKLAAATYLADMGADAAVEEIKKLRDAWNEKENNPYPQKDNPFTSLVQKIEAAKSGANDANAVKSSDEAKGTNGQNNAGGDAAAVNKDNELETAFGLKVIDKVTGKPIVGASVKIYSQGGREMKTNQFGRCLIELGDKKPDHLTVNVSKSKYVPRRLFFNPSFNGIAIPKNYVLSLEAGTVIGGIVKTVDGKPVKDATVKVRIHEDMTVTNNPAISGLPCKTDKDGRWICEVIPANAKEIYLEVVHDVLVGVENHSSRASIDMLRDKSHVLLMREGIDVVGSVVDVAGKPVAGADVFQGFSRYSSEPKTKTDAAGKFVFNKCSPGEIVLSVKAPGFAQDLKTVQVADGLEDVEFILDEGGTIIARFVDVDGKPIKGVRIEATEWRKRSMSQAYENIRIVESSDAEGLAVIVNAPNEEVVYNISKKGFAAINKQVLKPSDQEQEIVLFKRGKLVGAVVDAETGEAIKEFKLIKGIQRYRPGNLYWKTLKPTWQSHSGKKVTGGRYEQPFNYHVDGYAVKIEAEGYLPQVSPIFYNKGVTVEFDMLLSRGEGPSGLVHFSDGKAVVNADVIVASQELSIYIEDNTVRRDDRNIFAATDKNGAFRLQALRGDYKLVVIHEDVFRRVIPGDLTVAKIVELQNRSWSYANKTPVKVLAGKIAKLEIGGGGRTVTGKILLPAGISLKGLELGGIRLEGIPEKGEPIELPEMNFPEDILVMSFAEKAAWQEKWARTDEGRAFMKKIQKMGEERQGSKCYRLRLENDGSFVVEDVLPGRYVMRGRIHDSSLQGTEEYYRSTLCSVRHQVVIEDIKDSSDFDKPVDLGDIKVKVTRDLKVGDVAPGFELKKLDGKKIGLSDFKGKYLLLEKSMGNSAEFNTKVLPELLGLYKKFGGYKFEIISVYSSYGTNPESIQKPLKYYARHFGIEWTFGLDEIARLGDNPKIMEDYGTGLAVMHLIGPDGKIVAIESDIDKIKEAVEQFLTVDE